MRLRADAPDSADQALSQRRHARLPRLHDGRPAGPNSPGYQRTTSSCAAEHDRSPMVDNRHLGDIPGNVEQRSDMTLGGQDDRATKEHRFEGTRSAMRWAVAISAVFIGALWALGVIYTNRVLPWSATKVPPVYDLVRSAVAVAGLLGAAVAVSVALRRQRSTERSVELNEETNRLTAESKNIAANAQGIAARAYTLDEQRSGRERIDRLRDRYTSIAGQLGSDAVAVRLAGVYAMAALADDWIEAGIDHEAQVCIDVLCSYFRTPQAQGTEHEMAGETEVRQTITRVITAHIQPLANRSWKGKDFDFTNAVFRGQHSFMGAEFAGGGVVSFRGAEFAGERVSFRGADFSGGRVSFFGGKFVHGRVSFEKVRFSGARVSLAQAELAGAEVSFNDAQFVGGTVAFNMAVFSGGKVSFDKAELPAGGKVSFDLATFSGGRVSFRRSEFSGGEVSFNQAEFAAGCVVSFTADFSGGELSFSRARFAAGGTALFDLATFSGGRVSIAAVFAGGNVSFKRANFSGGEVLFAGEFSAGRVSFDEAVFAAGRVSFDHAKFAGATASFAEAEFTGGEVRGPWGEGNPPTIWPTDPA